MSFTHKALSWADCNSLAPFIVSVIAGRLGRLLYYWHSRQIWNKYNRGNPTCIGSMSSQGRCPAQSSQRMTPHENESAALLNLPVINSSGGMWVTCRNQSLTPTDSCWFPPRRVCLLQKAPSGLVFAVLLMHSQTMHEAFNARKCEGSSLTGSEEWHAMWKLTSIWYARIVLESILKRQNTENALSISRVGWARKTYSAIGRGAYCLAVHVSCKPKICNLADEASLISHARAQQHIASTQISM